MDRQPARTSSAIGCSVITTGYLPYARVLADSFREHNAADFVVLLVDDHEQLVGQGEPFRVVRPSDVGIPAEELNIRGLMYTPTEMVCSLRPALLRYLLSEGVDAAILLDGDGCVYGDLSPVGDLARERGTVFTPHFLAPHPPPENGDSLELLQIRYGVMNGGFLAVGPASRQFLDWLDIRLARYCVNVPEQGLYLDQRWLDLAVALFPHEVLKDPGCNVMCLNLQNRDVEWHDGRPRIEQGALRYFHFLLAFDPEHPEHLCNDEFARRWLPYVRDRPGALRLARDYAERLLSRGWAQARRGPQRFEMLPGGLLLERHMRSAYRSGVIEAERFGGEMPPNPFTDGDTERFMRWLDGPLGDPVRDAGLSRYRKAIRDCRADLAFTFPSVPGEHTRRFLDWIEAEREGEWMRTYTTERLVGR